MSLLKTLKTDDTTVKQETDSVGSNFSALDSNLYKLIVKLAYITLSKGKAMALNVLFETPEKQVLRQQFWVTSGEKKGCKNYYENQKTNEKHYLPGFNQANGLSLLTCDKGLNQLDTEKKTIKLYDHTQGKEVDTEVDMVMELIDKEIIGGVIKQIVDKNKADAAGVYQPTGETRTENEVDKFFYAKDGRTVTEIRAKETEAKFKDEWLEKWEGQTKDRSTGTAAKPGAPAGKTGAAEAPTESLFA